jgi:hypothetical protein
VGTTAYNNKQSSKQKYQDSLLSALKVYELRDSLSKNTAELKELESNSKRLESNLIKKDLELKNAISIINKQSTLLNRMQSYTLLGLKDSSDCPDSTFWRLNNIALVEGKDCLERVLTKDSLIANKDTIIKKWSERLNIINGFLKLRDNSILDLKEEVINANKIPFIKFNLITTLGYTFVNIKKGTGFGAIETGIRIKGKYDLNIYKDTYNKEFQLKFNIGF